MKFLTASSLLALSCLSLSAQAAGDINAGKAAAEKYNCASCHGKDYNSPIDPSYPKLAGQHADYLAHTLVAYQRAPTAPMAVATRSWLRKPSSCRARTLRTLPPTSWTTNKRAAALFGG